MYPMLKIESDRNTPALMSKSIHDIEIEDLSTIKWTFKSII